ncbi:hypothetical protein BJY04DRAFT_72539 [Aspergillus karnatakaensis]|uniref:uncharacterized protein n=1 Tax=Aspergillus karnatakaensis TaxID=1810916 RepID=UPI003CCCA5C9
MRPKHTTASQPTPFLAPSVVLFVLCTIRCTMFYHLVEIRYRTIPHWTTVMQG